MDIIDIYLEKLMNNSHLDNRNNYEIEEKSLNTNLFVENNKKSFDNWFPDTMIRIGLVLIASVLLIPIFTIGLIFSFIDYNCNTNLVSIDWLLFFSGLKTLILYNIIVSKLYAESVITEVSELTVVSLRKFLNIHMICEIMYNIFISYSIFNSKLSNCDIVPYIYFIIYLILNFMGCYYFWYEYCKKIYDKLEYSYYNKKDK